jgi:dUTP pyrophosphatase
VWAAVTEAGGAVGFTPQASVEEIRRDAAEPHLAEVEAGRQDLVVAREGGDIVGFGFLVTQPGPAVKSHLGVVARLQCHPSARGRGIGAQVLAELEVCARERGLLVMTLTVRAGTGVEAFYLAHGYRLDGRLPDRLVVDGSLTDELQLSKRLAGGEPAPDHAAAALRVTRLDPELPLPERAHPGDAGLDLHARAEVTLKPGERALVPTGVAVALPPGAVGLLHPRSGLALRHGVGMVNAPGTVDEGYRGELKVVLINLDPREPVVLRRGDRVAQLVVQRVEQLPVVEVDHVGDSSRGAGGFGSSGG